jgi:chemotaxis protein methyltransferase CheR
MRSPYLYNQEQPVSEFQLTQADFEKFSRLVYEQSGISLHDGKKELIKARLSKRVRQGRFKSFRDYYQYVVEDDSGEELVFLLDAISTNLTSFFREQSHFDYLKSELLPRWKTARKGSDPQIRVWSAGCSSGEEVYSISITLQEGLEHPEQWKIKILATDLSTKVLKKAMAGIYEQDRIRKIPAPLIKKYFLKGDHQWREYVKVKNRLRDPVEFKRFNLMEPFPFKEPFDCIFCRNVMIYFDKKTQEILVNRFYKCLGPEGILFIGHSESLTGIPHPFKYVKPAIYKK